MASRAFSPVLRVEDTSVPLSDGTVLAADLVTIDDETPRPTILVRTPYSRAGARAGCDPIAMARQEWSVVVSDVRGRFDSSGAFDPFRQEPDDGAEVVAWCAAQPWSDGRVITLGASYDGVTQLYAASANPPQLEGMALIVTTVLPDDGMLGEGGAFPLGWALPWALMMGATDPAVGEDGMLAAVEQVKKMDELYRHPLGDHPVRDLFPAFGEWLDVEQSEWRVEMPSKALTIDVPAFHVAGWFDVFRRGSLLTYQSLSRDNGSGTPRKPQRLVIGPWTHIGIFQESTAEESFGVEAAGTTIRDDMLSWLRATMDGEDVAEGVRLFVMGCNEWREYPTWPPPSTAMELWLHAESGANGLAGDGALVPTPHAQARVDEFVYDPNDPVPTRGGPTLGPFLPGPGPVDQRPVEVRDDVLVYTSAVLDAPITVIGDITADIWFQTSGRSADVTVKVVDVHPDGRAMCVTDSVSRLDFSPGQPQSVHVEVGPTGLCFLAGHAIRIEVSSSNFPRLDRNPSTGVPSGAATVLEGAHQGVHTGGERASRITLPIAED